MTLKQEIYNHYLQLIINKISMLQNVLADLKESSSNETKSTAGDKHETALAMLQIEQANTSSQLNEVLRQKAILEKINPTVSTTIIVNGSLIKTNRGFLFLSVALGKAVIGQISVIALSQQSPLGQKLLGLSVNDTAEINQTKYVIENIF